MSQGGIRTCPFYQIEFNAVAAGKTIAMSKRHIRWRFGFPNLEAVESGKTGTDCRGVEHEVTVVWSVTSGKRRIMSDNQEIHTSIIRSGVMEHSWVMPNNKVIKVVAHSTASTQTSGRQYDLFVNGVSYFSVPKVFELGIKGNIPVGSRRLAINDRQYAGTSYASRNAGTIKPPATAEQEEEELRLAISQSLKESQEYLNKRSIDVPSNIQSPNATARPATAPAKEDHDLLDLLGDSAPPPQNALVPTVQPPSTQWGQIVSSTPHSYSQPQQTFQSPEHQQPVGAFGDTVSLPPVQPSMDQFAPREPTYTDVSSQIMQAYSSKPTMGESNAAQQSTDNNFPSQISIVQQPMGHQQQYSSPPPRQASFHSQPNPHQYTNMQGNSAVQPNIQQNSMQASMQQAQMQQYPMQQSPYATSPYASTK